MEQKITMFNRKAEHTAEEVYESFLRKCKVNNLTDLSIISYQKKLKPFLEFVGTQSFIAEVSASTVDDFVLYLKEQHPINDISINSYLRSIRAYLYYAMDCGYIPRFKVKMIRAEKKIKETYTYEELERLLRKPNLSECSFSEFRVWTFINYMVGTGNRISTAVNVKIGDIDFENGSIRLSKTKNRRQQLIPLSKTLSDVLRQYLEIRGGEADDYLFCNEYGGQASTRTYQQLVRRYNIRRNVNKTSVHLFRHTFAKNWILAGGDIFRLQKILGHSDMSVVKEYVQMYGQDLQLDFEKFNLLDQLVRKEKKIIRM